MKHEIFFNNLKLTNGEKTVITFIEKNPREFSTMNISDVSKQCFFSTAGISKLCKKMGFESYKKMQSWVNEQWLKNQKKLIIDYPETTKDIANNIYVSYDRAVSRSISTIDYEMIDMAIDKIKSSSQTMTFGIGSSKVAAQELSSGLNMICKTAIFAPSIHDIFLNLSNNKKTKRLVITFSKTFSTKELKTMRSILQKNNVFHIIITANQEIKSLDNEIIIHFQTYEQRNRVFALSSKISQLMISDILLNSLKTDIKNNIYNDFIDFNKK